MKLVILESPYAGDVAANETYARACLRDCLLRGEAPIASHLLYTQPGVLDDLIPDERALGIAAGLEWGSVADATVVYTDRGVSKGMQYGIERAEKEGRSVEFRSLSADGNHSIHAAYASLASEGIPAEVRSILMDGDKRLGILPGALHRALCAAAKADRA